MKDHPTREPAGTAHAKGAPEESASISLPSTGGAGDGPRTAADPRLGLESDRHNVVEETSPPAWARESIRRLASGVAHDFNNLLLVITGNAELLQQEPGFPEGGRPFLAQMVHAAERGAALIRQLTTFSCKQPLWLQPVSLTRIIRESQATLCSAIGDGIEFRCACAEDLPRVLADAHLVQQMLMNLTANARDAMPKGGRFTLSTQAWRLEPALLRGHPQRRLGDFVVLQVEDTGPGIPADALPHIFEPFYTHRALGRKTGLGLAIIHDIVEQHRGWIEVDNAPGQGARFRIHLPVWQDNPAAPAEAPRPAQADGGRNAGLLGG